MATYTPNYNLPEIDVSQAGKALQHNESLNQLEPKFGFVLGVLSVEPGSPVDGEAWLVGPSPSGPVWGNFSEHSIAHYYGALWREYVPVLGWNTLRADLGELWWFNGSLWLKVT